MGRSEAILIAAVRRLHQELCEWREAHPKASFDEIAAQVTPRRLTSWMWTPVVTPGATWYRLNRVW
jgi:hypothetical protein